MPVYEFKCGDCGQVFEVMGKYEEREKPHTCPGCGSEKVKQAISGPLYRRGGVRPRGAGKPRSSDGAPGPRSG